MIDTFDSFPFLKKANQFIFDLRIPTSFNVVSSDFPKSKSPLSLAKFCLTSNFDSNFLTLFDKISERPLFQQEKKFWDFFQHFSKEIFFIKSL